MIRSQYDSREGIQASLESLGALHDVVSARLQVGYTGGELRPWTVLGRYSLGRNGYTGQFIGEPPRAFIPAEVAPFLHDVVPTEEVYPAVARATLTRQSRVNLQVSGGGFEVPTEHARCGECGDGWTVRTAHERVTSRSTEEMPLGDFVGQLPWAVHEALAARRDTDATRTVNPTRMMVFSLYNNGSRIDGRWRHVDGTYRIVDGDVADITVRRFMHPPCNAIAEERASSTDLRGVLDEAGFSDYQVERVTIGAGNKGAAFDGTWYRVSEGGTPFLVRKVGGSYDVRWSLDDYNGDVSNGKSTTPGYVSSKDRQEVVNCVQKLGGQLGFSVRPS